RAGVDLGAREVRIRQVRWAAVDRMPIDVAWTLAYGDLRLVVRRQQQRIADAEEAEAACDGRAALGRVLCRVERCAGLARRARGGGTPVLLPDRHRPLDDDAERVAVQVVDERR